MEKELYAEMAELEETHWWFRARHAVILDIMRRYCPRAGTLLDIGLGTGLNASAFSRAGYRVTGVEPSPEAVAFAQAKAPDIAVIESAFPSPAIPRESFDIVTLLDVLEHFSDDGEALRAVARALRPGGMVVITVPAFAFLWTKHDETAHHFRRYRRGELMRKLRESGLTPEFVSYYNFFLFPPIAGLRLIFRLFGKRSEESDFSRTPKVLNGLLRRLFASERYLLRMGRLPWGVSLIAVATKR